MSRVSLSALALGCLAALAPSAEANDVAPGFRIYSPHNTFKTFLIDVNGQIVHTWDTTYFPGNSPYLLDDGTLIRAGKAPNGPGIGGEGGAIERLAFDSTVLWDFRLDGPGFFSHHDIEVLPNGNVLAIVWDEKTIPEAVAAGRDPALMSGDVFRPDYIVEIKPTGPTTGDIVWEWHMWDHVIQDHDPNQANFGVVANHPELLDINYPPTIPNDGDWNHCNSISYDPVNDWIILNSPFQNELWIIDHSTTTAEAAGHTGGNHGKGGDILYRWGNPDAYRAGTPADQQLFFQHGTYVIPQGLPGAGNLLIFNNRFMADASAVHELVLPIDQTGGFSLGPNGKYGPDAPIWEYTAPGFFSSILSNAIRLPNGNTLVDSGQQGWFFEVAPDKTKVWEYFNQIPAPTAFLFRVDYVERSLWSDRTEVSASAGGSVDFDIVAGSPHAGDLYFLVGSISGTDPGVTVDGQNLPLNYDSYFLFTFANANSPITPGFAGTLDALGRAQASLTLPAGAAASIVGLTIHHAYAVVDASQSLVTHASNAVPLEILP